MLDRPGEMPVIVFDGTCVLCCGSARFVLRHDRHRRFLLTTAQGEFGQALYHRLGLSGVDFETMLLAQGDSVWTHSEAAIRIAEGLGWPWRAAGVCRALPRPVRDAVYRFVARNRYRWFGRRDTCWRPTPEEAERIL